MDRHCDHYKWLQYIFSKSNNPMVKDKCIFGKNIKCIYPIQPLLHGLIIITITIILNFSFSLVSVMHLSDIAVVCYSIRSFLFHGNSLYKKKMCCFKRVVCITF